MSEPYGLPAGTNINYKQSGFPAWVDTLCLRWGLDSSTYAGHQESDRPDIGAAANPQHLNRGIDWTGLPDRMLAFARWLVSIGLPRTSGVYGPVGLEMAIYQDPRTGEQVWYPPWVDFSGDLPNHTDHVHTRFSASVIDVPVSAVMTVPLIQQANGRWSSPSPAWAHLIMRESGGDPTIIQQIVDVNSGGNEAEGLFQITPATWRAHQGDEFAPSARLATPQQQAIVAARILTRNPSGSDWGAGLPGRENPAAELAAGLVPVETPAPQPPQEEDWMANPELEQMIREIWAALYRPASRYGDPSTPVIFDWVTEHDAGLGDPSALDRIRKNAASGDRIAAKFLEMLSAPTAPPPTPTPAPPQPPSQPMPAPPMVPPSSAGGASIASALEDFKAAITRLIG